MRNFLKTTLASLIGSLAGLLLFFGLGAGGLVFLLITASRETGVQVKDKSVLVFDTSVGITDADPTQSTSEALGQVLSGDEPDTMTLRTVLDTLDKAIQDPKIIALYLDGSQGLGESGFATLKEVRGKLERFRATGKKVIAYDAEMGERELYLSSVANTVILNPMGAVEINGISSEPGRLLIFSSLFANPTLDKKRGSDRFPKTTLKNALYTSNLEGNEYQGLRNWLWGLILPNPQSPIPNKLDP